MVENALQKDHSYKIDDLPKVTGQAYPSDKLKKESML